MMTLPSNSVMADEKQELTWKHVHPMLSSYTYKNLDEPKSLEEAHMRMVMHRNAVEDIEIQIKIAETHHGLFLLEGVENQEDHDKYVNKSSKHFHKIIVLLNSMLMHKRRAAAYWYWLQCHEMDLSPQTDQ